ncbi:hypothetical protein TNCV_742211 [Trichonephila clavipes]|nr:hypothetical protein TNCV_742211 [Trichonephila clavipes]
MTQQIMFSRVENWDNSSHWVDYNPGGEIHLMNVSVFECPGRVEDGNLCAQMQNLPLKQYLQGEPGPHCTPERVVHAR